MIVIKDTHPEVVQLFKSSVIQRELAKCILSTSKPDRLEEAECVLERCMDLETEAWGLLRRNPLDGVDVVNDHWTYAHHKQAIFNQP